MRIWVDWLRRRPIVAAAVAVVAAAVILVVRDAFFGVPDARALVAKVNSAYRSVPGYASTIEIGSGPLRSQRVTLMQDGLVMAFAEEVGSDTIRIHGVADTTGIWIRPDRQPCWTRSGGGPDAVAPMHLGEPLIPTNNVRYEAPTRVSGGWKLRVIDSRFGTHEDYVIDGKSDMVRSITLETTGTTGEASRTQQTLRTLATPPEITRPTPLC